VLQGLVAGIGFLLAGTTLALMILALLPQVRPYTDTDETLREDTGALQQTAVRAHDKWG
jgi:hypothetical protein